eukprot:TRINITY_DN22038_c0_g2_i2.p1 TRINITY_DN22038_c0_g2~~TRINITY_DN22038_c0_g2_i2.p1  ORF type:complete len:297 (+),score=60.27 TRINITY_DN22038_c0_g2_i2:168-1058(+)
MCIRDMRYCNDWVFLVGFIGLTGFVSVIGAIGLNDKLDQYDDLWTGKFKQCIANQQLVDCDQVSSTLSKEWARTQSDVLRSLVYLFPIGLAIVALSLAYMRFKASQLVRAVIISELASLAFSGILNMMVLNIPFAVYYFAILLLKMLMYWCFRGALKFAAAMIETSVNTTIAMVALAAGPLLSSIAAWAVLGQCRQFTPASRVVPSVLWSLVLLERARMEREFSVVDRACLLLGPAHHQQPAAHHQLPGSCHLVLLWLWRRLGNHPRDLSRWIGHNGVGVPRLAAHRRPGCGSVLL